MIRLRNGRVRKAELYWYEAHGIGKEEIKRKRYRFIVYSSMKMLHSTAISG